jgi:hypothetical protein
MKNILTENELRRYVELMGYKRNENEPNIQSYNKKTYDSNEEILKLHRSKINEERQKKGFKILISEVGVTSNNNPDLQIPFQAGQYKDTDGTIKSVLEKKLQPYIDFMMNPDPGYFGHFIKLTFEASADSIGLSSEALKRAEGLGITSDMTAQKQNELLSEGRLQTIISLAKEIISQKLGVTVEELETKIIIDGNAVVNTGQGSQYRYVKATISKGANYIPEPPPIPIDPTPIGCSFSVERDGRKATSASSYVGFEAKHQTSVKTGQKVTLSFDSLTVPDAFYVKYGDVEKFSGFIGAITWVNPKNPNQRRDFKSELSNLWNNSDLEDKINAKIASFGGKIKASMEDFVPQGTPTELKKELNDMLKSSKLEPKYHDWARMLLGYTNEYKNRADGILNCTWVYTQGEKITLPPDEFLIGSKSQNTLMLKTLINAGFLTVPSEGNYSEEFREKLEGTDANPTENDLKLIEEEKSKWKKVLWTIKNASDKRFNQTQRGVDGSTVKPEDITKSKNYIPITKDIVLEMIKNGPLQKELDKRKNLTPNPLNENGLDFNFEFTKGFEDEWLVIICFSPLDDTRFTVKATCG